MSQLETIDEHVLNVLTTNPVDANKMVRLLNKRKQCLASIAVLPELPEKITWSIALKRTKQIVILIKEHRDNAAAQANRIITGHRSVQVYKKFE
ncbi:hypothetical protein BTN50_0694 [Candidatus Enterovibrio altilux]|uniref:Uncharacterized protein n=1 Tax=Candidatus Enterovibrio altilux TaxID=1927128 RepID=A0A291B893_9GAMM|nr:hypothetical protein BTN50_0694 [Candidatus Enterovibrio luxaltus]